MRARRSYFRSGYRAGPGLASAYAAPERANRGIWSTIVLRTAILAFLCQSLAIQGHFHADRVAHAAAAGQAAEASSAALSGDDQSTCPICQEIAQAGTYLAVVPATFLPPTPIALWREVTSPLDLALRQRSHAWQSRAPPLLQA